MRCHVEFVCLPSTQTRRKEDTEQGKQLEVSEMEKVDGISILMSLQKRLQANGQLQLQ